MPNLKLFFIPIIAGFLAQLLKFTIKGIKRKKFSWKLWEGYGGAPSVHTTFVISLLMVIALAQGIDSPSFAIAMVFTVLTIRDALGLRRFLGNHARILNKLISDLPNQYKANPYPLHLRENLGHTPLEVLYGALFGGIISAIFYLLF